MGGISIWQLLIILLIVIMIFGTKRLSSLGKDLGGAVKGFKEAVNDDENDDKKIETGDAAKTETAEKSVPQDDKAGS
ncbi:MAG: Sec-independent protein translocase subunit TatA [bacterium]